MPTPTEQQLETLRRIDELAKGITHHINPDVVEELDDKGWVEIQPKGSIPPILLTEIGRRVLLREEHSARG